MIVPTSDRTGGTYEVTASSAPTAPLRRRSVPGLVRLGAATIGFGVLLDLSAHSFAPIGPAGAGFDPSEHAAHLVVLIGMVAILLGVIADGVRSSGRASRPERSSRDALR
jgi:hypothetical protein